MTRTLLAAVVICGALDLLVAPQTVQAEDLPSLSSAPNAPAPKMVNTTCYRGNPANNGVRLGNMTVPSAEAAGPACNAMYPVCQGNCYGCLADFDYSQDICVNNAGKKFLR